MNSPTHISCILGVLGGSLLLAEVFAKPAHRKLPLPGCCAFLNLALSMKQTYVSAYLRELSIVHALSLRAKHTDCAKDSAVSGGRDERMLYQSWEKREHLPEDIWACHETEGEQGASRSHSNYGPLHFLSLQNCWDICLRIVSLLGFSYSHFPLGGLSSLR